MILRDTDIRSFYEKTKNRGIACFGIGLDFRKMVEGFNQFDWDLVTKVLVDNNKEKQGKSQSIQKKSLIIQSTEDARERISKEKLFILIVSGTYFYEIFKQLDQIPELQDTECYIYGFMKNKPFGADIPWKAGTDYKIPARIYYCWLGGKEKKDLYKRCIDSWYKKCPEYEIIELNESNCDIGIIEYTEHAYEAGNYAFAADYFRLKCIYDNGGIYLDTDIELLKNLDVFRCHEAFCGLQASEEVAFGLGFGAEKGNGIIRELMEIYENTSFSGDNGNEVPSLKFQTDVFLKHGLNPGNKFQMVENIAVYPSEVFSPMNLINGEIIVTDNTYSIHYYDGSWVDGKRLVNKTKRLARVQELKERINYEP